MMAFESGTVGVDTSQAFIESLQNDLKNLSLETKKKYPQIKEVVYFSNNSFYDIIISFLVMRRSNWQIEKCLINPDSYIPHHKSNYVSTRRRLPDKRYKNNKGKYYLKLG